VGGEISGNLKSQAVPRSGGNLRLPRGVGPGQKRLVDGIQRGKRTTLAKADALLFSEVPESGKKRPPRKTERGLNGTRRGAQKGRFPVWKQGKGSVGGGHQPQRTLFWGGGRKNKGEAIRV